MLGIGYAIQWVIEPYCSTTTLLPLADVLGQMALMAQGIEIKGSIVLGKVALKAQGIEIQGSVVLCKVALKAQGIELQGFKGPSDLPVVGNVCQVLEEGVGPGNKVDLLHDLGPGVVPLTEAAVPCVSRVQVSML